jgi:hypothetical protein
MSTLPTLFANDIGELWIENEHEEMRDADLVAHFETDEDGWLDRAELIVTACNSHEQLVAELTDAETLLERIWQLEYTPSQVLEAVTEWRNKPRAALALATPQPQAGGDRRTA